MSLEMKIREICYNKSNVNAPIFLTMRERDLTFKQANQKN